MLIFLVSIRNILPTIRVWLNTGAVAVPVSDATTNNLEISYNKTNNT